MIGQWHCFSTFKRTKNLLIRLGWTCWYGDTKDSTLPKRGSPHWTIHVRILKRHNLTKRISLHFSTGSYRRYVKTRVVCITGHFLVCFFSIVYLNWLLNRQVALLCPSNGSSYLLVSLKQWLVSLNICIVLFPDTLRHKPFVGKSEIIINKILFGENCIAIYFVLCIAYQYQYTA